MKAFSLFFISLVITPVLQAQVILVPFDYSTIQQAINAASPGDTVLVAESTYYEQINFLGKKPLLVASHFLLDGDTSHITNTIIDGSQLTNMDSASVVYFISGEDTTSVLCGFTIRGGKGSYTANTWHDRDGGGIWISGAGAKIIHNRITGNTIDDSQSVNGDNCYGAGICTAFEDADHWVVITNNVIDSNMLVTENDEASGAGIYTVYKSRIAFNTISDNTSFANADGWAYSGGVFCGEGAAWSSDPLITIKNNTIKNNHAQGFGATGGGVYVSGCKVDFSNNEVTGNQVITATSSGGIGGLGINMPREGTVVRNNFFRENSSNLWGGGLHIEDFYNNPNPETVLVENNYFLDNEANIGGAFVTVDNPVVLQNNVFSGNHSYQGGAAYLFRRYNLPVVHFATLVNNSFSGNQASVSGGAVFSNNSMPLIINSVFWGDSAANGREIFSTAGDTVELAYTTIFPAYISGIVIDGGGNLNDDPLFLDPILLYPSPSSYCINTGILAYTCHYGDTHNCPGYDITGAIRPQGSMVDMGAYEMLFEGVDNRQAVNTAAWICSYPNPFSEIITFEFESPECTQVSLTIINHFGQQVASLVNNILPVGKHQVKWDAGNLPAGIYYFRLQAGDRLVSDKIIKIR